MNRFRYLDPNRFRQIVINLLSNAAKFTQRGHITVQVSGDEMLRIRVSDTGQGISPKVQRLLFQPFQRGDNAEVLRQPGSGLGLALSSTLAKALGGELRLLSSQVGVGSTFEFSVPLRQATHLKQDETLKQLQEVSLAALQNTRILVAEDSPDLQLLVRRYLENAGATVIMCPNGAVAVTQTLSDSPDVVLMDLQMPVMDGYEAASKLREAGFIKPVIAVTAHASDEDRKRCRRSGFTDYISKPIDLIRLIAAIQKSIH